MYAELLTPSPFRATTFPNDGGYDELVVARDIPFHSLCEHHPLPFIGVAHVAYLPGGRIIGLSKLARVVESFSRGLQVQERLTTQVAGWLQRELAPKGVGVVLEAEHLCMSLRGVPRTSRHWSAPAIRSTALASPIRTFRSRISSPQVRPRARRSRTSHDQPNKGVAMSSAVAATLRPVPIPASDVLRRDPAAQAFMLLRITFFIAPVLFGLDKFAEVLTDNWTQYLAVEFNDILPGNAQDAMYLVGGVEIVAGLVVLVAPRFGGLLVAGWLAGIILSLLLVGGYGDIALRDFGLLLGALTLARLASANFNSQDARR